MATAQGTAIELKTTFRPRSMVADHDIPGSDSNTQPGETSIMPALDDADAEFRMNETSLATVDKGFGAWSFVRTSTDFVK